MGVCNLVKIKIIPILFMEEGLPGMPTRLRYIMTLIALGNTLATNKLNSVCHWMAELIRQNCNIWFCCLSGRPRLIAAVN